MAAEIRVPKLNSNDASYVLVEWLVADGAAVRRDDAVASVETSKTVEELVSEHDGVLTHLLPEGADCTPGQPIARIAPAPITPSLGVVPAGTTASAPPLITAPAQALMDELGVDPARVRALPVKVVRRADVERLAGATAATPFATEPSATEPSATEPSATEPSAAVQVAAGPSADETPPGTSARPLSRNQRAVGRTVAISHQTIPAAYTAIKVDVGPATAAARDLGRRLRRLVGLPDLLVSAVARLHRDFPLFFATLLDDGTAAVSDSPHVGVTVDLGAGLYVPVIRDAHDKNVPEIAAELAEFRKLAQHGGFREEQLAGGNIVVTLHHDADIVMAVPIVFPGQSCAVALTSPQQEGERTVAVVGLAYDHRLINGRDAVLFLQALKEAMEREPSGEL
jgi:2-oxoglutarate dehydrogenase E2 component (dihydrolipoamide succinyltransferase)